LAQTIFIATITHVNGQLHIIGIEFAFPKLFGKLGDEYDKRYGLDDKYLARIAEKNYSNARKNPNAQTRDWFMNYEHASTIGDYNAVVGGRVKVTDCSQVAGVAGDYQVSDAKQF